MFIVSKFYPIQERYVPFAVTSDLEGAKQMARFNSNHPILWDQPKHKFGYHGTNAIGQKFIIDKI